MGQARRAASIRKTKSQTGAWRAAMDKLNTIG
jgi:hypothetical protein